MVECREYPRIPVELRIFFSTTRTGELRVGTTFDISAGGCAIASTTTVNPGTGVTLQIQANDLGSPITVHSAEVRWAQHGEFGVEFLNLTELDRSRLGRLLRIAAPPPAPQL